jgi:hypothetical protein
MKRRNTILTLAVGATLVVGVPTAQGMLQQGDGSFSVGKTSSSRISAATLSEPRAEYNHLMSLYGHRARRHVSRPGGGMPTYPDDRATGVRGG